MSSCSSGCSPRKIRQSSVYRSYVGVTKISAVVLFTLSEQLRVRNFKMECIYSSVLKISRAIFTFSSLVFFDFYLYQIYCLNTILYLWKASHTSWGNNQNFFLHSPPYPPSKNVEREQRNICGSLLILPDPRNAGFKYSWTYMLQLCE